MTLTGVAVKNIIRSLLKGEDYRAEVITLIDAQFLEYVIEFFGRVLIAKSKDYPIGIDWYKAELLNEDLPKEDIAIHAGLNMKTISNTYHTTQKNVVIDASLEHYEALLKIIEELVKDDDIDVKLTLKINSSMAVLSLSESLIVINTIAVKRAALRGGAWSTAGKQVEKPLMTVLCRLFQVPEKYFDQTQAPDSSREVDFVLIDKAGDYKRCEVKLMGRGNPESADAVEARATDVFVADTLSEKARGWLDDDKARGRSIQWVELRSEQGFQKFGEVLKAFEIPHKPIKGDVSKAVEKVLAEMPNEVIEEMAQESENPVKAAS